MKKRINQLCLAMLLGVVLFSTTSCSERIDAGSEGILVNLYETEKGVDDVSLVTHGAAIQRKTPALDWGKCLSSGGLGDFYCWRFRQEVVYLVSNLRCKGSDYFNNNNNNNVNKAKTTVYLDFI